MRRRIVLASVVALVVGSGCRKEALDRVERSGEPDFMLARSHDVDMEAAMRRARETLSELSSALADGRHPRSDFAIKKAFSDGKRQEYIWLIDPVEASDGFHATVDNAPVWVKDVKAGTRMLVRREDVADWMFVEDGVLHGGFTIRVLFRRETPERKLELERTFGFKVPPP
ncbi:MAG: DUF2314 domain-containing protein [Anaeromyxobacteraceae bacterium]